uniref:NAD(P)-dependent oxidoreductase n=1 Tax=Brachyspira sp. SAP_772 TaxID=2608385 RepID=UPI0012F525E6
MATIYYDNDADLNLIKEKTIAIIGYGNQGRSQAINIRDSGIKNVIIGSRKDESYDQANEDGFMVYSIEEASKKADIIYMLLPDEVAPQIYEEKIAPNLKDGNIINFSSAYNITFKRIVPAKNLDIVMAAPRMIGKGVRELYEKGEGSPAFVGVHQDYSGKALEYAKALCKAIGATRKGAIEVKFDDETFLDLMAEQGTWPIIYNVFVEAFKLQVEMGHPEEAVLMEMYLSKEPAVM